MDSVVHTELSENSKDSECGYNKFMGKSTVRLHHLILWSTEVSPLSSTDLTPISTTSLENSISSKSVLDVKTSLEAPKKCYFVDVKEAMPPGVEVLNTDRISESVLVSSNIGDETLAACHGTEHSGKHDPIIANDTENIEFSSIAVADEASNKNLNLPVLQPFESKELES